MQRSHVLFVLSDAKPAHERAFREWYGREFKHTLAAGEGVISVHQYEQHDVDITQGQYAPLPLRYLALCELAVDGAQAAAGQIEQIFSWHREQPAALPPAAWLYYPVSEKVGRAPANLPSLLTLAFANAVAGREAEFREWYATRHIRHALHIPALVSGQCFERTQFQHPGALEARFSMIAVYEQEGTAESIIESFASIPPETFAFPALDIDPSRFAEWVYRPWALEP